MRLAKRITFAPVTVVGIVLLLRYIGSNLPPWIGAPRKAEQFESLQDKERVRSAITGQDVTERDP